MAEPKERFLVFPAALALAVLVSVVAALAWASTASAKHHPAPKVKGIELSHYPWVDDGVTTIPSQGKVIADEKLLDAFARDYAEDPRRGPYGFRTNAPPSSQDFFLFWLPNRIYGIVMGEERFPRGVDIDIRSDEGWARTLWLGYLAGYYSGVWERLDWALFYPEFPRTRFAPVTDAFVNNAYTSGAGTPTNIANHGSGSAAIDYSRFSLRGPGLPGLIPFSSEVGVFGFEANYVKYILPPWPAASQNATLPVDDLVEFDDTKLLTVDYGIREEGYLKDARKNHANIKSASARARKEQAIVGTPGEEHLFALQTRTGATAAAAYNPGTPGYTSYRRFDQEHYDRLVNWSVYALMINQANSLNGLAAWSNRDSGLARAQARSTAWWWLFTWMYVAGGGDPVSDGKSLDEALPRFEFCSKHKKFKHGSCRY
jgi:hypothetical protein